jgi:hypothetical protein
MIWREKRILLIVLGLLLAANTIFFFTYRVRYESRLQDLEDRRTQSETRLTQARAMRVAAERRVADYRKAQRDVRDIYEKQWSTEAARLSALIVEVKRLTAASQLVTRSISYVRTAGTQQKKSKVAAEVVAINFTVQGNYQQIRRLINLFELSRQFVIIDQISLTSADNQNLTLTLQLKTLFRDTGALSGAGGASKEL